MIQRLLGLAALALACAFSGYAGYRIHKRVDMQGLRAITVAQGLVQPWAMVFLPDGRMLVTERPGRMRVVGPDGALGPPLAGLPPVYATGEGGLLDVVLDPAFADNARVYWTFSESAAGGAPGAGTAVASGRLQGNALQDVKVIYRQADKVDSGLHFGSRLLFDREGKLLVGLGDRSRRDDAQRLDSAHGKILRLEPDGRPAAGNPFLDTPGALPEIWSYGHRNVQGMAFHPVTGELWATEHGPQGGDELNVIAAGRNYGWPVITYGCEYRTCAKIGEGSAKPGMEQPVQHWGPPSNAPSGMAFLTSDRYPGWKGQMFIGTLRGSALVRMRIEGHRVVEEQRLVTGLDERIRDVRQGPDGWLYILTHDPHGRILRIEK
jgi:glucose/arabinose dehydrogenase